MECRTTNHKPTHDYLKHIDIFVIKHTKIWDEKINKTMQLNA
jgi:hypothetical protein